MINSAKAIVTAILLAFISYAPVSWAQLSDYIDTFENYLIDGDPDALEPFQFALNGWKGFLLVKDSGGTERFPGQTINLPNGGPGYSAIAGDEQGPEQGSRYANIYSDYNCCSPGVNNWGHFDGTDTVETFVFQEQTIGASDIGKVFTFYFDAKRPSPDNDPETAVGVDGKGGVARAFIKTIDPNDNFNETNLVEFETTNISQTEWGRHEISIDLSDPLLDGQLLQFGFYTIASDFANTGVYYDNLVFTDGDDIASFINVPIPLAAIAALGLVLSLSVYRQSKKNIRA